MAISTPDSRAPTSCSTRHLRSSPPDIIRSRRAARWRYWQNGKLYLHCSTQSVVRTVDAVARWVGIEPSNVVLISEYCGGGFGSKGGGIGDDGDPGAAVEEGQRAGDDAREPRRGELLRARAHQHDRPRQSRLPQGWPHHRARSLHRPGQRAVWADGRSSIGGQRGVAHLAAAGDAVARRERAHQHAAAHAAAIAGADAGERHHRAGDHEGGGRARPGSGGDPADQFTGGQGAVWSAGRQRPAPACDGRVRQRGARQGRGALRLADARRPLGQAAGRKGARRRRRDRSARLGIDRL